MPGAEQGPLRGVRVLELTQIIAGPYCGMNLADLGADVVKIEPPEGEAMRALGGFMPGESKGFHSLNRGKRSLVIDLHEERGRAVVHRLLPAFDVFVINSRPGVSARIGVDYETLRKLRADLIYMENTGYGTRGPSAERSGSDIIAQAYSGLMAGDGKVDEYGAPLLITSTAPADYAAGLSAAMGICAALYHRERTGEGQYVATSLLGTAMALQGAVAGRLPVFDAMVRDPMLERVNAVRARGGSYAEILEQRGSLLSMLGSAFRLYYGGYQVKDGAIILGALTPHNRDQIRGALGIDDDPSDGPEFNAYDPANGPVVAAVGERIRSVMLTRTMDEWGAAFDAAGAPVSKVNLPEEMSEDRQVQALGCMLELEHDLSGPEQMVGPPLEMAGTPVGARTASPPLDRDTDALLREHGFAADEIAALRVSGAIGARRSG
ncbi:MAG: CoA transferase [Chloroflexi bacterium]|nr:CoA transferase [Chloroflexota bacterium]MDA1002936.1 CoA transferase [Chloroflexota bacterium]